jgi:hypothetical protein
MGVLAEFNQGHFFDTLEAYVLQKSVCGELTETMPRFDMSKGMSFRR